MEDIRLHMDGLFELKDHAVQFTNEFISLYTNGRAGGGGIRSFLVIIFVAFQFTALAAGYSENVP